jgi:hypothetical protein
LFQSHASLARSNAHHIYTPSARNSCFLVYSIHICVLHPQFLYTPSTRHSCIHGLLLPLTCRAPLCSSRRSWSSAQSGLAAMLPSPHTPLWPRPRQVQICAAGSPTASLHRALLVCVLSFVCSLVCELLFVMLRACRCVHGVTHQHQHTHAHTRTHTHTHAPTHTLTLTRTRAHSNAHTHTVLGAD